VGEQTCRGCHNAANNGQNVGGALFDVAAERVEKTRFAADAPGKPPRLAEGLAHGLRTALPTLALNLLALCLQQVPLLTFLLALALQVLRLCLSQRAFTTKLRASLYLQRVLLLCNLPQLPVKYLFSIIRPWLLFLHLR